MKLLGGVITRGNSSFQTGKKETEMVWIDQDKEKTTEQEKEKSIYQGKEKTIGKD